MTKKLWCHDDVVVPTNLKKNLPGNLWPYQKFRCTLALQVTKRTNKIEIFGFSDPANFLHQPASSAPSKYSSGCTGQTRPNRLSADSLSRILLGNVLESLSFSPQWRNKFVEWSGGNSQIYFGPSLVGCGFFFF